VLGLASSGPHSNGYSLIRKVIERSGADLESILTQTEGATVTLGSALMAPTNIYVKPVLRLLRTGQIDGLAHITGGGLTENIVRALPGGLGIDIDTGAWTRPEVFNWLQEQGGIEEIEMLRTFNCGIGMVMIVPEHEAASVALQTADLGIGCFDIGAVITAGADSRVHYRK
jgi:phosphoribosylformylglycinamidine cyclo-ligase